MRACIGSYELFLKIKYPPFNLINSFAHLPSNICRLLCNSSIHSFCDFLGQLSWPNQVNKPILAKEDLRKIRKFVIFDIEIQKHKVTIQPPGIACLGILKFQIHVFRIINMSWNDIWTSIYAQCQVASGGEFETRGSVGRKIFKLIFLSEEVFIDLPLFFYC